MVIQLYTFYRFYSVNILMFQQNLVFQPVPSQILQDDVPCSEWFTANPIYSS